MLLLWAGLALIPPGASAAGTGIVSCATFAAALRDATQKSPFLTAMQNYSSIYQNSANGQKIRFLAVRPTNANGGNYETLVFFNGTSQITPDWPVGMLVNSATALCDNSALVFSDYPGIGETAQPAETDFTFDNISSNVYSLLTNLNDTHGFNIKAVDRDPQRAPPLNRRGVSSRGRGARPRSFSASQLPSAPGHVPFPRLLCASPTTARPR